jgi:dihydrofolate synthase / folylpolyglutamate synthase
VTPGTTLESLEQLGWRFGLETIQALLSELGNPQQSLQVVHVAGSNGKGSTCAFMASFLKQSGYKTGLYTSPHLSDIRERFRINGTWIPRRDFDRYSGLVLGACQRVRKKLGHLPTHFEALTAIAFSWFKEQKVDWVVLEVGLGGRLDSTNVIPTPAVCLITSIGLEHQNILGKTIGKIAWEKAGILKEGCLAATLQPHPEAARIIERAAREKGALLWLAGRDFTFSKKREGFYWEGPGFKGHFKLPGFPEYQAANAALAVAGIQLLKAKGVADGFEKIQKAFLNTYWPARMELVSRNPLVLLDGAHNPEATKALFLSLNIRYPGRRWIILNGFLRDKDYKSCAKILSPITALSIVTEPNSERAEEGERVFEAWEKAGTRSLFIREWKKALRAAQSKSLRNPAFGLLITGSLYLVGDCRNKLTGKKGLESI